MSIDDRPGAGGETDLDGPPVVPRPVRMLLRAAVRRCPLCGSGGLFRRWLSMEERCPGCGHRFERRPEDGFCLGSYVINLAFTFLALGAVLFLDIGREAGFVDIALWALVVIGVVAVVAVPLVGYPLSKTLWSALDLAARPPDVVEQADAAAHRFLQD